MALWSVDLTTEDGALGATGLAGYVCFVAAALTALGAWFLLSSVQIGATAPIVLIGQAIECLLFVVTGFRLRAGKGIIWGIVTAALIALELVYKLILVSPVGIVINAIFLILIVNGIRGALALRRGFADYEEQAKIFS